MSKFAIRINGLEINLRADDVTSVNEELNTVIKQLFCIKDDCYVVARQNGNRAFAGENKTSAFHAGTTTPCDAYIVVDEDTFDFETAASIPFFFIHR